MINKLAQIKLFNPDAEGLTGYGPLGNPEGSGIDIFSNFISTVIGLLTIIGVIWFIFVLITGAIGMISAGGDKAQLEAARKRITSGLIGLVIIISAVFILDFVGFLFGIDLLNITDMFDKIQLPSQ